MPKEEYVAENSRSQAESREHPDDESIQHTKQYRCLLFVLVRQDLYVDEELDNGSMTLIRCVLSLWDQFSLQHRVESQGIDDLSRSFSEDDSKPC